MLQMVAANRASHRRRPGGLESAQRQGMPWIVAAPAERQMNAGFSLGSSARLQHAGSLSGLEPSMTHPLMRWLGGRPLAALALLAGLPLAAVAADTNITQQLDRWSQVAGAPADAARGAAFFGQTHGGQWSCASCHGKPPTRQGEHASTGKRIDALAPAFNPKAFTVTARVDKWFRRNCKDVLARECSAAEKADVLAYLSSLR
jgi:hypothetical protein